MQIKKKTFCIIIFILLVGIITITTARMYLSPTKDAYQLENNLLTYSKNRETTSFQKELKNKTNEYTLYKISFESRPFLTYKTTIQGLLFLPNKKEKVPGIVYLPGGGVSKESASPLAEILTKMGYAVLIIDQRGIGETGGYYLSLDDDYKLFTQGNEPIQHLSVYDGLKTFDVLRKISEVDEKNIAILGESMGGRYALIAGSLDDRIKGEIIISASGFHFENNPLLPYNTYLQSIDPDNYVEKISPRPVFFFQGTNDSVQKINDTQKTFDLAKEPKKLFIANGCGHGYCNEMKNELQKNLKEMFEK